MHSLSRRALITVLALALILPGVAPAASAATTLRSDKPAAQDQQDPKTEQAWFDKARNLYARGKYDESITILTDFLKTYPDSMIKDLALLWLSRSYMQQGRLTEAETAGNRLRQIAESPFIAIFESDMQAARAKAPRPQVASNRPQPTPQPVPSPTPQPTATPAPSPTPAIHQVAAKPQPSPSATPAATPRATPSKITNETGGNIFSSVVAEAGATPSDTLASLTQPRSNKRRRTEDNVAPMIIAATQPIATYSAPPVVIEEPRPAPNRRDDTPAATTPAPSTEVAERVAPQPGAFSLTIKQVPNLTLALARAAEVAQPGQVIQIPLTVTNTGNKTDHFRLQTDLPAEYQPSFAATMNGTSTNLPIFVTPELARNTSMEVTLTMRVPPGARDGQSQSFQVRAASQSNFEIVRLATGTVTVHAAALAATTTTAGEPLALPGTTFKQTIIVTNSGNSTARETRAEFIFNPEYELVTADPSPVDYDIQSRTAVWLVGNLESGKSKKIQVNVRVTPGALAQTNALGRGSLRTPSIPLASNFSSPNFTIGKVNRVQIEALSPWLSVTPGDTVFVPLVVRNPGNAPDSYHVRVVAPGTPASTLYADTNGDGRHQEGEPAITETASVEAQGGQYRMLLGLQVPTSAATGQQFSYNFVALSKTSPSVASETSTMLAVAAPRLRIRTEQITQSAAPGDLIYYRLILINEGSGLAQKIVVTEVMAGGLDFVSSDPKVKVEDESAKSSGTVTWKVEDLAPNTTKVLLITARVKPDLQADSTLPARHSVLYQDTNGNAYQAR